VVIHHSPRERDDALVRRALLRELSELDLCQPSVGCTLYEPVISTPVGPLVPVSIEHGTGADQHRRNDD
jgi:hypothetical protein